MAHIMPGARHLIIIGAGGHAREVAWVATEATQPLKVLGFLDDRADLHGQCLGDFPVLGPVSDWLRHEDALFVVAIGSPRTRRDIVEKMHRVGSPRFATLIHRSAVFSPHVTFGEGTMVMAGCVLSTQIQVGRHVILNQSSTISHDDVLEDYCTVAPGVKLSGNVTLREGSEVGIAACIRQGLTVGRGAMVGMGSVVTKSVLDARMVYGNPARVTRTIEPF